MSRIKDALLNLGTLDRFNPMEDGYCLYTDPDEPDHHCIAGQAWVDVGGSISAMEERTAVSSCLSDWGSLELKKEALSQVPDLTFQDVVLLQSAQTLADGYELFPYREGFGYDSDAPMLVDKNDVDEDGIRKPRKWSDVVALLKQHELL